MKHFFSWHVLVCAVGAVAAAPAPTISFSPGTVMDTVGKAAKHSPATTGSIKSCASSPSLPSGLGISGTTCVITGTPTVVVPAANYTITATNGTGSGTATLNLAVLIPKPTVSYAPSTVVDTIGKAVTHTATTTGMVSGCRISPALPAGLSINSSCVITGTPTVSSGATNYTVTDSNSTGLGTTVLNLAVLIAKPTVSYTPSTVADTIGKAVTHTPATTGLITGCTISPALPAGLAINASTCIITGTPTTTQTATVYTLTASNSTGSGTATLNISVLVAKPVLAFSPNTAVDTISVPAVHTPVITGPITGCTISPALPAGLNINALTCAITGTPTTTKAATTYTLTATNSTGSGTATLNLAVLIAKPTVSYAPSTVVDTIGKAATHMATTTGTVSGCRISPALPAGLSINSSCVITGTPTVSSVVASYTVTDSNSTGTGTTVLNLAVLMEKPTVSYTPNTVVDVVGIVVVHVPELTGTITSCVASPSLPLGLLLDNTTCMIAGTPLLQSSSLDYTVTATGPGGTATAVLNISVNRIVQAPVIRYNSPFVYVKGMPVQGEPPVSTGGAVTTYAVNPALPSGLSLDPLTGIISGIPASQSLPSDYTVTATGPGGSDTVNINIAVYSVPANLSYADEAPTDVLMIPSSPDVPSVSGLITHYSVNPALPAGLYLDSLNGAISGTPAGGQSFGRDYIVTASNPAGSTSASVNITVVGPPSNLSYLDDVPTYAVGQPIAPPDIPTVQGIVTDYSIVPSLPDGIFIDGSTGSIQGTPTTLSPPANYTVIARNPGGSVTTVLLLGVETPP